MIEYSMSISDRTFMSLPFVYFSLRIYYFFIYKPNLLLKNIKFFSFKYLIWSFVLINMDNTPTVNARERCKCENVRGWKNGYAYQTASPLACCLVNLLSCQLVILSSCLLVFLSIYLFVWSSNSLMSAPTDELKFVKKPHLMQNRRPGWWKTRVKKLRKRVICITFAPYYVIILHPL